PSGCRSSRPSTRTASGLTRQFAERTTGQYRQLPSVVRIRLVRLTSRLARCSPPHSGSSVGSTSLQVTDNEGNGAEEGTRTPTPLRVHGPEPCASANSATSASDLRSKTTLTGRLSGRTTL